MRPLEYLGAKVEVEVVEACPWCGHEPIVEIATRGDGLPVMRCTNCHLAFVGELPRDLSVFYDKDYYKRSERAGERPPFAGYEDYARSYSASSFRWLSMLIRSVVGPEAKRIFDLGAATGTFLQAARLEGFEVHGSELNDLAAAASRSRGLNVTAGAFDPDQWQVGTFDVVTALEVLEHVRDLRSTLLGLKSLLAMNGLLVFLVPNVEDNLIGTYGDSALDFHKSYDHTFYFNAQFLNAMCTEMFGPNSLTLFTHESEEWGQTVSAALGFVRMDTSVPPPERRMFQLLGGTDSFELAELSAYDALALALTAAKFSEREAADNALGRAAKAGAAESQLSSVRAQVHRHRGELITAVAAVEQSLTESAGDDPFAAAILTDCLGDLLDLMGADGDSLSDGFEGLLYRLDSLEQTVAGNEDREDRLRNSLKKAKRRSKTLAGSLEAAREDFYVAKERSGDLAGQLRRIESEASGLREDLNLIYRSRSWRLITFLRSAKNLPQTFIRSLKPSPAAPASPLRGRQELVAPVEHFPFLVSVIMPVFNKGATLRESVDSVLAQTLTSVEIVVWDDGSTDATTIEALKLISALPRVEVFRGANMGVVHARNNAMGFSRGKYICCLDPDDLIDPTYLEKAVAILESDTRYSIAYPFVQSFGDVDEFWETQDLDPAIILEANHVPICAVFDREIFIETAGFSKEMDDGYEDWEYWAHAAELGFKGKAIPEPLFKYRFSRNPLASRDAVAREKHRQLTGRIRQLHPYLAISGEALGRDVEPSTSRPLKLRDRSYPPGKGRPIVLTLPWFTVGGADTVVEAAVRSWTAAERTVIVLTTSDLGLGMADRRGDLRALTPFVYALPDLMPIEMWSDFLIGILGSLDSPVIWNVGSQWLYKALSEIRTQIVDLRIVDQQFNKIGHLESNRATALQFDATITAYAALGDEVKRDGRGSTVATVYAGIDDLTRPSQQELQAFRNQVGLRDGEKLILYVGRLSDEKRPQWMGELAGRMRADLDTRIALIGNGPLRTHVTEAVRANPGMIWLEEVESVAPAIAAASVLALPSRIEGIPLVALEALSLGTPIVATRVGGLPDLEELDGVSLTDPDDIAAFEVAIRHMLNHQTSAKLPPFLTSEFMLRELNRVLFDSE